MTTILYRFRYFLLSIIALVTGLLVIPVSSLKIDNSVDVWFYQKDTEFKNYTTFLDSFGAWDYLAISIQASDQIYTPKYLQALLNAEEKIAAFDGVIKITSIASAKANFRSDQGLSYAPLLDNNMEPEAVKSLQNALEKNLVYADGIVKPGKNQSSYFLIQVDNQLGIKEPKRIQMINKIREVLDQEPAFKAYHLVGTPNMNAELNHSSRRDMFTFYPLVSLLVLVFAWMVFRSLKDLVVTFSVVLSAIIWSMGSMMLLGYNLNMLTILMGTVLMSLSIASVVHLITHFHQVLNQTPSMSALQAARISVSELRIPCFGAALTTIFGFLSLIITGVLPITLLGVFSALGIFLAFIFTFSIGSVLLITLWDGQYNRIFAANNPGILSTVHGKMANALSQFATTRPILVVVVFTLGALSLGSGLINLGADSNYLTTFKDRTQVAEDYSTVEAEGFGSSTLALHLTMPSGIEDEATFRGLLKLSDAIQGIATVSKVISPMDIVMEVDRALSRTPDQWSPGLKGYDRSTVAQLLLVAESSGNDDLKDYLAINHKEAQISVFTPYLSGLETLALKKQIEHLIATHLPDSVSAKVVGVPIMWANMDRQLFKSQLNSLLFLAVVIFAVLLFLLKSLPMALIGLVVNFLPITMILGLMGHLGVKIDIATVLIGGIAMGIAVDDTIHVLWRYKSELEKGMDPARAIATTLQHTGMALVLTSILLIGGFSVMTLSDFTPTANFGLYTCLMVLTALIADLLLLPALLFLCRNLVGSKFAILNPSTTS